MSQIEATSAGVFATSRRGGITPYEVALIEQLAARRVSTQNIAMQLARSQEDVRAVLDSRESSKVSESAIPTPKATDPVALERKAYVPPNSRQDHFLALYMKGEISLTACARSCGKTRVWVRRSAEIAGGAAPMERRDGWTPEQDALVSEMTKSGYAAHIIGAAVGRTEKAVISRRHRLRNLWRKL